MAQAANTADFLGEGTVAQPSAPPLTQQQLDDMLLRRNIANNTAKANQVANINNSPGGLNHISQTVQPHIPSAPATMATGTPTFAGSILPTIGAIVKSPAVTALQPTFALGTRFGVDATQEVVNQAGLGGTFGTGAGGGNNGKFPTPTATPDAQRPASALDAAIGGSGGSLPGGVGPVGTPAAQPSTGNPGAIQAAMAPSQIQAGAPTLGGVNQALTNFRPAPAAPPTGTMASAPGQVTMGALPGREAIPTTPGTGKLGALPGTVQQGALPGTVSMGALPGDTDRSLQTQQLNRLLGYDPNTASKAEAQLADAQQMNLSNSLALARSARGGPAAQAQALRQAQGEGAATMSQTARDLATLRAQEEDTAKQRELAALGLGNDLTGQIRSADIGERGQNVGALEAALTAGTEQRGQTIGAITANQASLAAQRGQTIDALLGERQAGVAERGQTIGAQENALNAGVSQRGQDVNALEAALTAGVTQRGQTVEQQIAERNAGVTERGQTTAANTAANQQALDAILGTGQLAQSALNAGVTERGQNITGTTAQEQIAAQRDIASQQAATEAQKTAATLAAQKAALGYELTPQEQLDLQYARIRAGQPTDLQKDLAVVQAIGSFATK